MQKKFNCKIIIQNNKGFGSAIIEGFKHASNKYGCIFNADYSFDPKYFEEIINKASKYSFYILVPDTKVKVEVQMTI